MCLRGKFGFYCVPHNFFFRKNAQVTGMFGWILKTNWDIGRIMEYYRQHRHAST